MDLETIAKQARKSISSYCINECKAYCCRKGFLIFTPKESSLFLNSQKKELMLQQRINLMDNKSYSFTLAPSCVFLQENFMCSVHKRRLRPLACKQFPLFMTQDSFWLSSRCPAVKDGKLYPFIAKFLKMGLKEMHGAQMADSDFYNNSFSKDLPEPTSLLKENI